MKKLFVAAAAGLGLAGCASIIKGGGPQSVTINSTPEGAAIHVVNREGQSVSDAMTPATLSLKPGAGYFTKEKYTVTIKKDGYAAKTVNIEGSVNGWYIAGNLVFGGLIGYLIVDPATGAMWTLKPDMSSAELNPVNKAENDGGLSLNVVLAQDLPLAMWNGAVPVR